MGSFLVTTLALGCTAATNDTAAEDLGTSQEALTTIPTDRFGTSVYINAFIDSGGFSTCPGNSALVGIDQPFANNAIACMDLALASGVWDSQNLIRENTPTLTKTAKEISNNLNSWFDNPSQRRVLSYIGPTQSKWLAVAVNLTTGALKFRLATGGNPSTVRADSSSVIHYNFNGFSQEIHACQAGTPIIHGANVILNYPTPIKNVVSTFDFSCVWPG